MAYLAQSNFISGNVALQGKDIKLSFPTAIDRNQDTVSYSLQYTIRPIYCNIIGGVYVCTNDADNEIQSSWETISGHTINGSTVTVTRTMPSYPTDILMKYTIKATDGTSSGESAPILSGNIYLIRNVAPTLQISVVDWDSSNNIIVSGFITDSGLTHPANYASIGGTTAWTNWRTDLKYIFDEIDSSPAVDVPPVTYSYYWAYGTTIAELGTKTPERVTGGFYDFNLSKDWIADNTFSFTIANPAGASSANSYYIEFYLKSSIYTSYIPYIQLLLNKMPVLNIKKGALKVNFPQSDTAKTGALMASHGPQQSTNGDSIALYDYHTESGNLTEAPSIGFYDTNNTKFARIGIVSASSSLEIKNLITGGNINLTPGPTGGSVVIPSGVSLKIGTELVLPIPSLSGNNGKFLTVNSGGTTIVWTSVLPIANGGTAATTAAAACDNIGAVKRSGDNLNCEFQIVAASAPTAANMPFGAPMEVREVGLVGAAQSSIVYAPAIGFHWGSRTASALALGSDGWFYRASNDGNAYKIYDSSTIVPVVDGGTGATDASTARTNLAITPTNIGALPISGGTMTGTISRTVAVDTDENILYGTMAGNDQYRIRVGGASDAGYLEIATADGANEPIYIRQYSGVFTTLIRTATLLDGSGNTIFPGRVTAANLTISGTASLGSTVVPIANGGTYATTPSAALTNLGIFYAAVLPATGVEGQICLVPIA